MTNRRRNRMWPVFEFAAACVAVATLIYPRWIELAGFDPDAGNGSVERVVAIALLALALVTMVSRAVRNRADLPNPTHVPHSTTGSQD